MYHRLVCIAGNVGGPSEIITDKHDGYLIPMTEPLDKKHLIKFNHWYSMDPAYNGTKKNIF